MRLFTASELPDDVREMLAGAQTTLKQKLSGKISWTAPKNLHLTLKFLGEVGDADVMRVCDALRTVSAPSFSIAVSQLGSLPPRGPARVLMADVIGETSVLSGLFDSTEAACEPLGFAREKRKFHPHITLARLRMPKRISREVGEVKLKQMAPFQVREFVLMQSTLSSAGSHYEPVARFSLSP
jgi:RNA 2',3'-cyclic 3'-phosphodiesterase